MGRNPVQAPLLDGYDDTPQGPALTAQSRQQVLLARREPGQQGGGGVGRGDELDPQRLGQRLDQGDDQLVPQTGYLPGEVLGGDPVQHGQRNVDGDPVDR